VLGLDRIATKYVFGGFRQALLPVLNLIGFNVVLLGQLSQGALTLQAASATFASNAEE